MNGVVRTSLKSGSLVSQSPINMHRKYRNQNRRGIYWIGPWILMARFPQVPSVSRRQSKPNPIMHSDFLWNGNYFKTYWNALEQIRRAVFSWEIDKPWSNGGSDVWCKNQLKPPVIRLRQNLDVLRYWQWTNITKHVILEWCVLSFFSFQVLFSKNVKLCQLLIA